VNWEKGEIPAVNCNQCLSPIRSRSGAPATCCSLRGRELIHPDIPLNVSRSALQTEPRRFASIGGFPCQKVGEDRLKQLHRDEARALHESGRDLPGRSSRSAPWKTRSFPPNQVADLVLFGTTTRSPAFTQPWPIPRRLPAAHTTRRVLLLHRVRPAQPGPAGAVEGRGPQVLAGRLLSIDAQFIRLGSKRAMRDHQNLFRASMRN